MIVVYLIVAILVNITDSTPRFVDGINVCFNSDLSGVAIFWLGLIVAFILESITD